MALDECLEAVSQSPHADEDAGDVNEGAIHEGVALVPHNESAEAVEPREESSTIHRFL
jgi:hypothetical protein